ncbi:MAG TPA: putative porin [Gemmatimonadaceae bacterium]|nr:putative porin [Gemmatimonadaceae bacterium]
MHRHTDPRDTVAEMAARAQEISQEAGSRIGKAMKDVIGAAAGFAGFAVESARDLVQYMVRRGQMTQEEADRLIRDAEEAYAKQKPAVSRKAPAAASEAGAASRRPAAKKGSKAKSSGKAAAKSSATKAKRPPAARGKPRTAAAKKKKGK